VQDGSSNPTPLFLYNTSSREVMGPFVGMGPSGKNICAELWEGRYPAQVSSILLLIYIVEEAFCGLELGHKLSLVFLLADLCRLGDPQP
jgi:hypothetical protein